MHVPSLSLRTTVTSARIPDEDACYRACNLCDFSYVQKGTQGLTNKGCVLQRVSFGALSDVMVVLGMRQSIDAPIPLCSASNILTLLATAFLLPCSFFLVSSTVSYSGA